MATETTRYNLKKPDYNDTANIQDINSNMDIIDEELGKQAKQINDCLRDVGDKQGLLTTVKTSLVGAINSLCTLASHTVNGLMSKEDKAKLDGIQASATNYVHPQTHPASMITGLPTSLPANGGNANIVGGMTLAQIKELIAKAGDIMGKTFSYEMVGVKGVCDNTWKLLKQYNNISGGIIKLSIGVNAYKIEGDLGRSEFRITVDGKQVFEGNSAAIMCGLAESEWAVGEFIEIPFNNNSLVSLPNLDNILF